MAVRTGKILTTILKWLLYIILVTGIVFLMIVLDIVPSLFVDGKLIFIIPHKILGYVFFIFILFHAFSHRKWYEAWCSGKISNKKNNRITKLLSVLFLILIFFFLFEAFLPLKIYACGHSIIGMACVILMIYHICVKVHAQKRMF